MTGISYLPDQARWANGIVVKYMIEISLDGIRWEEAARGEFANIQNNPVEQQVIFWQTHKGRYIRFHALSTVDGQKSMGVAELDILFLKLISNEKYNYVGWCMAGSLGLSAMSGQAAQPEKSNRISS